MGTSCCKTTAVTSSLRLLTSPVIDLIRYSVPAQIPSCGVVKFNQEVVGYPHNRLPIIV